jgi:hypothetical protein
VVNLDEELRDVKVNLLAFRTSQQTEFTVFPPAPDALAKMDGLYSSPGADYRKKSLLLPNNELV